MFNFSSANKGAPAGTASGAAGDLIKEGSDRTFMADVIEASRQVPVIVDFWAPWCGPCKQLGPALEAAVKAAKGAVKLVKIDTDQHPMVAQQLRVQSIPAVYAFFQGRPVDGFVGAQQDSQVKSFVDRLTKLGGGAPGDGLEDALAQAKDSLDAGEIEVASDIYGQILQADPENAVAYAGLVRCLIATQDLHRARQLLDNVPAAIAADKEIAAAKTALDIAEQAAQAGPVADLKRALEATPDDHQIRFDLAMALYAEGAREEAVAELLELFRRDRTWNDDGARKQLVKFFEAFGPTDPLTIQSRRKLSSLMFR